MSQQTIVNVMCDGEKCNLVRSKDANHWLVGVVAKHKGACMMLAANRDSLKGRGFQDDYIKDFCGEECAVKWVSKNLTEIKKNDP
jgi:hypothetical protein